MRRPCHLFRRHNTWVWRRRIPAAFTGTAARDRLVLSLRTSDLRGASRIGFELDAAFEGLLIEGGMDAQTVAQVMAHVRDEALARGQAKRAARPADRGFSAPASRQIVTDLSAEERQEAYAEVISAL